MRVWRLNGEAFFFLEHQTLTSDLCDLLFELYQHIQHILLENVGPSIRVNEQEIIQLPQSSLNDIVQLNPSSYGHHRSRSTHSNLLSFIVSCRALISNEI